MNTEKMEEERHKTIDKALAAFTFGTLQDLFTLELVMEREGISKHELYAFVELKQEKLKVGDVVKKYCPECGAAMVAESVNVSPRTMIGDDSKIVYTCTNHQCMHQIFE